MSKYSPSQALAFVVIAMFAACTPMRDAMEDQKNAVARADGHTLTIEHLARLLASADASVAPPHPNVVDAVADLWIGYTLLTSALASPDTFSSVDITPLIQLQLDQENVWGLRREVILANLEPTEGALLEAYRAEQPYTEVELQQLFVRLSEDASPAQIDEARRFAEDLRQSIADGADFDELAAALAQDTSGGVWGGELGWVGRGRLVPELDSLVFFMEPGTISEAVRSSFGYHIVRVTDREEPDLEEVREEYRLGLMERRVEDLEKTYIDSLFDAARVRAVNGVVDLVKSTVNSPRLRRLSPAEQSAALARYRGGSLTLGEWAHWAIRRFPDSQGLFGGDSTAVVTNLIELVRNELLVRAARELGYAAPKEAFDTLQARGYRELTSVVIVSGLQRDQLVSGELSIQEAVDRVLIEVLTQERSPAPLARAAPALKSGHTYKVYPERYAEVVERLIAIRLEGLSANQPLEPGS